MNPAVGGGERQQREGVWLYLAGERDQLRGMARGAGELDLGAGGGGGLRVGGCVRVACWFGWAACRV